MNTTLNAIFAALLILSIESGSAFAQSPVGAEARIKQMNITLPPPIPPIANYVGAVQVGKSIICRRDYRRA